MPLVTEAVGRRTEPVTVEVDRSWVSCFAGALGVPWPQWLAADDEGPQEAHPVFPIAVEWPVVRAANALMPDLGPDELARGVHASHRLRLGRPIRPGDRLTTTATVDGISGSERGGRLLLVLETVAADDGELVARTEMGTAFLGVRVESSGEAAAGDPVAFAPRVEVAGDGPAPLAYAVRHLDAGTAYVYSACSRIWNPIHTDPAVAAAAGLPGPIVHGSELLGMAVTAVLRELPGGPAGWRVAELACRFTGMIVPPADVRVVAEQPDAGGSVRFEVRHGASVRDGHRRPGEVAVAGTVTCTPR